MKLLLVSVLAIFSADSRGFPDKHKQDHAGLTSANQHQRFPIDPGSYDDGQEPKEKTGILKDESKDHNSIEIDQVQASDAAETPRRFSNTQGSNTNEQEDPDYFVKAKNILDDPKVRETLYVTLPDKHHGGNGNTTTGPQFTYYQKVPASAAVETPRRFSNKQDSNKNVDEVKQFSNRQEGPGYLGKAENIIDDPKVRETLSVTLPDKINEESGNTTIGTQITDYQKVQASDAADTPRHFSNKKGSTKNVDEVKKFSNKQEGRGYLVKAQNILDDPKVRETLSVTLPDKLNEGSGNTTIGIQITDYQKISEEGKIFEGRQFKSARSQPWSEVRHACIWYYNTRDTLAQTIESCKTKCEKETTFVCRSIDYVPKSRRCVLTTQDSSSTAYRQPCSNGYQDTLFTEKLSGPNWPLGSYGLPATTGGCPGRVVWQRGYRFHDCEDYRNNNQRGPSSWSFMPSDTFGRNIKQHFCMKTSASSGSGNWPSGKYCIFQYGSSCPVGFVNGYIYWDDQDMDEYSHNNNDNSGYLPEGEYDYDAWNKNTKIYYCCRNDGSYSSPMVLPTSEPFFLFRFGSNCQKVEGMGTVSEWLQWDTEDTDNHDRTYGAYPSIIRGGSSIRIYYCFYW